MIAPLIIMFYFVPLLLSLSLSPLESAILTAKLTLRCFTK